ncbi:hypothetical protein I7I48_11116 [Histoplasma ohiense]|nr:hypothetical protein I7I48_11116 [Histoplasma ohiense (nom. inval.)]
MAGDFSSRRLVHRLSTCQESTCSLHAQELLRLPRTTVNELALIYDFRSHHWKHGTFMGPSCLPTQLAESQISCRPGVHITPKQDSPGWEVLA